MVFDLNSLTSDYVDFLISRNPCIEGIDKLKEFAVKVPYLKDISAWIDSGKTEWNSQWTYWTVMEHGDQMTVDLRISFYKRLVNDPFMAYKIYKHCEFLTDPEDELLLDIFEGKITDIGNRRKT